MIEKELAASVVERLKALKEERSGLSSYADETLACLTAKAHQMAVVASWRLLMFVLYNKINDYGLGSFSKDISARNVPMRGERGIHSPYDLNKIDDSQLISACHELGFFDRNIKGLLERDLQTRNGCAHPSQLEMSPGTTIGFLHGLLDRIQLIRATEAKGKPLTLTDNLLALHEDEIESRLMVLSTEDLRGALAEMLNEAELVSNFGQAERFSTIQKILDVAFETRSKEGDRIALFEVVTGRYLSGRLHRSIKVKLLPAIVTMVKDLTIKRHVLSKGHIEGFVSEFTASDSFDEAGWISKILSEFAPKLSPSQVEALCRAVLLNDQVSNSFGAQANLKEILRRNREGLDAGLLEQVRKVPGFEI